MMSAVTKFFFRQRQRNRLYDQVVGAIEDAGVRREDIAEKLGINPSQVSRWLSGPASWEQDTISDLLFAIDAELEFRVVPYPRTDRNDAERHAGPRTDAKPV